MLGQPAAIVTVTIVCAVNAPKVPVIFKEYVAASFPPSVV